MVTPLGEGSYHGNIMLLNKSQNSLTFTNVSLRLKHIILLTHPHRKGLSP
eukprot:UN27850